MDNCKILILSYTFSNLNEIGGKRWSNFAIELAKDHYVDVITSDKMVLTVEINNVYYIKSKYPSVLNKKPISFIEKIQYKYALLKQKICFSGSYYDKGKNNLKKLKKIVLHLHSKNNYNIIITSGAPFSWLKVVPELKNNNFPDDNVLIYSDLRDPWTWGIGYGMDVISKTRKNVEKKNESIVIKNSDKVFVPSELMKEFLDKKYSSQNIYHLPHGFNKAKINESLRSVNFDNSKEIKLIYGGTWYKGTTSVFNNLLNAMSDQQILIEYNIYTNTLKDEIIKEINLSKNIKLKVNNYTDEVSLFKKIYRSNFYILILPEIYCDFLSAKFFEICYIGTPIIYIGKSGLVSDFITTNNFGFHLLEHEINNVKNIFLAKGFKTNENNDVLNNYTFGELSKIILHDINNSS